ncbi:hypothetical protein [Streptomyces sp. NPDC002328]|uniref:hypothetical protein n=1 Tax=Streptomyces sp. NPDC002328 TaxID=3364642 RepID=UPI0036CD6582
MNLTAVLDHTALGALFRADPFFTGLYIEASRATGRVIIPSLSVPAAERQVAGVTRPGAPAVMPVHVGAAVGDGTAGC